MLPRAVRTLVRPALNAAHARHFSYDVNKAILVGRLIADPTFVPFSTDPSKFVTRMTVVTSEKTRERNSSNSDERGKLKDQATFHNVVTIEQPLGEYLKKYAYKGQTVYVEGRMSQSKYVDKDGNPRTTHSIEVNGPMTKFLILDKLGSGDAQNAQSSESAEK